MGSEMLQVLFSMTLILIARHGKHSLAFLLSCSLPALLSSNPALHVMSASILVACTLHNDRRNKCGHLNSSAEVC